jgi:hypothetical protein
MCKVWLSRSAINLHSLAGSYYNYIHWFEFENESHRLRQSIYIIKTKEIVCVYAGN